MSGPNEEDYVAFHGNVYLKNCIDSHKTGMRIQILLENEEDYKVFKSFKKHRKGKAGTGMYSGYSRHRGDENWFGPVELRFISWSMSSSNGAVVTFEIDDPDQWRQMRKGKAIDAGYRIDELEPVEFLMVELDQEGQAINIMQRAKIESYERKKQWPKGGPQSKRAARLGQDVDFINWLRQRKIIKGICKPADIADWIRKEADIDSRAQLDHDPAALERFEDRIVKPFLRTQMH